MPKLSAELLESLELATQTFQASLDDTAVAYLEDRGIGEAARNTYRLGYASDPPNGFEEYEGMIAIPYLTQGGIVNMKFRRLDDRKPKYLGLHGRNNLYNVRAFHDATDTICVAEGELDALVLSMSGVPTVGIPGATNLQKHYRYLFQDYTHVVAFCDGDKPGRELGKTLRERIGARPVYLPDGEDCNSLLLREGIEWFQEKL